ncbi:hypothetical protein GCY70_21020 [Escherichia coli]|nr:hypothetical protein [Escherichia coli]
MRDLILQLSKSSIYSTKPECVCNPVILVRPKIDFVKNGFNSVCFSSSGRTQGRRIVLRVILTRFQVVWSWKSGAKCC